MISREKIAVHLMALANEVARGARMSAQAKAAIVQLCALHGVVIPADGTGRTPSVFR